MAVAATFAGCVSDAPAGGPEPAAPAAGDAAAPATARGGPGETIVIDMTDALTFDPGDLVIKAGTRVVWKNVGAEASHDVTHDAEAPAFQSYEASYDAGNLGPGDEYAFTFDAAGEFPYFCKWHGKASMAASLTVV